MSRKAPRQAAMLAVLRERGGEARLTELAEACGMDQPGAWDVLAALKRASLVENPTRGLWRLSGQLESNQEAASDRSSSEPAMVLPRVLPDTGLPQANPFLLRDALVALTRWCAAYTGPADDRAAVEATLACMHVQRALGVSDAELLPRSRGWDELVPQAGE